MSESSVSDHSPPPGPLQLCKAAGFRFPVFISWPHLIRDRGEELVRALSSGLENRFRDDGGASVFLDVDRIKPGYVWNEVIRTNLCRSAVTVVFLLRTYFESEFCCTEWAISEQLSQLRLDGHLERSCLIPIALTRGFAMPREVRCLQFEREFQELLVYGRDVKQHEKWNQLVDNLVELVYDVIERVCQSKRDWETEETLARKLGPKRFSWANSLGSGAPSARPVFPRLSVEKPAA